MKSLIFYILVLVFCIGSAYFVYYYLPESDSPYINFAKNVAEYIVKSCSVVKEYLQEPIQWVLLIGGVLLVMHGLAKGSGLLVALGLNIAILGLGWQVAKEIYSMAYNLTQNPLFSAFCVLLAAIIGSSVIKSWLRK